MRRNVYVAHVHSALTCIQHLQTFKNVFVSSQVKRPCSICAWQNLSTDLLVRYNIQQADPTGPYIWRYAQANRLAICPIASYLSQHLSTLVLNWGSESADMLFPNILIENDAMQRVLPSYLQTVLVQFGGPAISRTSLSSVNRFCKIYAMWKKYQITHRSWIRHSSNSAK